MPLLFISSIASSGFEVISPVPVFVELADGGYVISYLLLVIGEWAIRRW